MTEVVCSNLLDQLESHTFPFSSHWFTLNLIWFLEIKSYFSIKLICLQLTVVFLPIFQRCCLFLWGYYQSLHFQMCQDRSHFIHDVGSQG